MRPAIRKYVNAQLKKESLTDLEYAAIAYFEFVDFQNSDYNRRWMFKQELEEEKFLDQV